VVLDLVVERDCELVPPVLGPYRPDLTGCLLKTALFLNPGGRSMLASMWLRPPVID
jgi:hypothetical protein